MVEMKELSPQAKAYITCILLVGVFILIWFLPEFHDQNVAMVLALGILVGFIQAFKVKGVTTKSSYNISLFIYGFTFFLLGPSSTMIVIVVAHLIEWLRNKNAWFVQFYSIASYVIITTAAAIVNDWISSLLPTHDTTITLALVVSMVVFVFLDHFSERLFNLLLKGEDLSRSDIFSTIPLMIDLTLLYLGVLAAFVWQVNAYAVVLTIAPLILIYSTSKIPKLKKRTRLDPKTGLYNSRYFEEALETEVARSGRFNRPLTVAMADMDFMRNINNTYGHLAGDEVLLSVARILNNSFREYDVVARFGGEEFAILLPEVSIQEAYYHFESLRREIEEHEFHISTSEEPIQTTICFGLSEIETPGQPTKEIIHNADRALYKSKMTGRNKVSLYFESGVKELFPSSVAEVPAREHAQVGDLPLREPIPETTDPIQHEIGSLNNSNAPSNKNRLKPRKRNYVDLYIGVVAITSFILLRITGGISLPSDWLGISLFAIFLMLTEWFSVKIYVKSTTIPTSIVVFIAGALLFGPFAVVILAFLIASITMIKRQNSLARFIFNFSNHLIGGIIVAALVKAVGGSFQDLALVLQVSISILAAGIVYASSTLLIAGSIDLDKGQPFWQVWNERFRCLAPSYLLIGLMIYFLIFSYISSGLLGILVFGAPLLLLRYSQKQYVAMTETAVNELQFKHEEIIQRSLELDSFNESLLQVLAKVIEHRDPYAYGHSEYVAKYACSIAEELGMPERKVELIYQAALLHDIGKLAIPESVLLKPGILTDQEYDVVQQHSRIGAEILEICPSFHEITPWILHHHERYDGWGYPSQLIGDEIPVEAKIIALADAVDSMASDRPYRTSLETAHILDEVRRNDKLQFDPEITDAFFRIIQREGISFIRNSASMIPSKKLLMQEAEASA